MKQHPANRTFRYSLSACSNNAGAVCPRERPIRLGLSLETEDDKVLEDNVYVQSIKVKKKLPEIKRKNENVQTTDLSQCR